MISYDSDYETPLLMSNTIIIEIQSHRLAQQHFANLLMVSLYLYLQSEFMHIYYPGFEFIELGTITTYL